jgi:hypothetical protein
MRKPLASYIKMTCWALLAFCLLVAAYLFLCASKVVDFIRIGDTAGAVLADVAVVGGILCLLLMILVGPPWRRSSDTRPQ